MSNKKPNKGRRTPKVTHATCAACLNPVEHIDTSEALDKYGPPETKGAGVCDTCREDVLQAVIATVATTIEDLGADARLRKAVGF